MSKYKVGQKVTIEARFYAPVNGIVQEVKEGIQGGMFQVNMTFSEWAQGPRYTEYTIAYEQRGFRTTVNTERVREEDIRSGWHGMKCNGDYDEFKKFGVADKVPGLRP